ncbi:hypothetical protein ACGGAQ_29050 [Micromonospora sp. NPDC047557]|uniref:hypothetical protein n=1 Tax=Micromonospora sp. NPDC047557 TaxID=3364250 RepID=UPI003717A817
MSSETAMLPVTGSELPASGFRLHQTDGEADFGAVVDVLDGRLAAYRITNFISEPDRRAIESNFWESIHRSPRYGEGEDGVEAYIIGASHIEKTTDQYLSEVAAGTRALADLYAGTTDPISAFRRRLGAHQPGVAVRAARHGGRVAADSKAVCWNNAGEFQLLPHDDLAQLSDPLQKGFEIQQVRRVMAINAYPQAPAGAGQLRLWNVEPDDASRARLGLTHSGYPYPHAVLRDRQSLTVEVAGGDLVVINGNLVHAVLGGDPGPCSPRRLLLTAFTGRDPAGDILWWT